MNSKKNLENKRSNIRFNQSNTKKNTKRGNTQEPAPSHTNLDNNKMADLITQVDKKVNGVSAYIPSANERLFSLSPSRTQTDKLLPQKSTKYLNNKTLVLDLDETLVHSDFKSFNPSDIILKIELEKIMHNIHVLVRPYAEEFLIRMSKNFELVIFTASLSKYADPLLDIIDKNRVCQYRLFREHCTMINGVYVKDLKRLNRDLKDIIIVDNSPMAFAFNQENGFPIKSWYDDKNDKDLCNLANILEFMTNVYDVRKFIPRVVENNKILYSKANLLIKSANAQNSAIAAKHKTARITGLKKKSEFSERPDSAKETNIKIIKSHINSSNNSISNIPNSNNSSANFTNFIINSIVPQTEETKVKSINVFRSGLNFQNNNMYDIKKKNGTASTTNFQIKSIEKIANAGGEKNFKQNKRLIQKMIANNFKQRPSTSGGVSCHVRQLSLNQKEKPPAKPMLYRSPSTQAVIIPATTINKKTSKISLFKGGSSTNITLGLSPQPNVNQSVSFSSRPKSTGRINFSGVVPKTPKFQEKKIMNINSLDDFFLKNRVSNTSRHIEAKGFVYTNPFKKNKGKKK